MNQLQVFNHEIFGELQVFVENGNVYFPATEVAKKLGYADPHKAIKQHTKEKGWVNRPVLTSGGTQQKKFIDEGNLYRLIVKSQLPEAEKFEVWVFDEILPTIRKTGGYVANEDMFINTYLPFADEQTKMMFRGVLETVRRQNEQIAAMKPKVEYFDALVDRNLLTNFRDTAKELQIKERFFIDWLLKNKFIYRDQKKKLKPYAAYVPELFELKEWERNGRADVQTLITPKGRETFRLLLKKEQTA
ncbi:phage antirepressor KilAC domain-containing protein [Anoxybacillus sp. LAT_38]|uniref:phage antirepressor KilAC domain-containing protein n=1 Tax=Anoxybacillus sp. LAT_26 TaxID=2862719 RepID=UPI001EEBF033|nr:phage antirepressor KilAC domain-containing protein [Anoxybacillus sp. LAT_26]MCG6184282.1 phage antirepressor KilAC domain-containing protein [Anoxybacillus sp. LAT_26]MCG6198605.1 phage antirepressor KilAC domain-containing protein [Anoxybacillus sp. LAT_38]